MLNSILNKVQRLQQDKQEFAIAYVINRQVPSSGKPGDKAIIVFYRKYVIGPIVH